MKKIIFILCAILSVGVLNSCKDEEPEKVTTNNVSDPSKYKSITELKSYTGKTTLEIDSIMSEKGYVFYGETPLDETTNLRLFLASDYSGMYELMIANDTIYLSVFAKMTTVRDTGLYYFEKYTDECVAKMVGVNHEYEGVCSTDIVLDSSFTTHQNFWNFYIQNKSTVNICNETWVTNTEVVSSYFEEDEGTIMPMLMYVNMNYAPASILGELTKKTSLKKINPYKFIKK